MPTWRRERTARIEIGTGAAVAAGAEEAVADAGGRTQTVVSRKRRVRHSHEFRYDSA